MCILFWTYHHPKYALVLCSNRDEFADRETLRAHRWKEDDTIIGGKDCVASGTWLAVSTKGKLAAVLIVLVL